MTLLLLLACSDYGLNGQPDAETPGPPRDLSPKTTTDVTHQRPLATEVDVLWVIDNSCSMEDDQQSLTAAFPSFMNFFIDIGLDYHIGVISTDMDAEDGQGRLREAEGYKWIDPTFPDPIPFFQFMASLGTAGSGDEMGRAPVYNAVAVQGSSWNEGFFRETSILSTIVISDEDDSSDLAGVTLPDFVGWYRTALKPDPELAIYSTIVGPTPDGCATAVPGFQHVDATAQIGGLSWSICDNRWDELLEALAIQSAGLKREFFLTRTPIVESLEVEVEEDGAFVDFERDRDFTYDGGRNSITFLEYVPQPNAEIHLSYAVEGSVEG
jgi:hypothetical protein